MSNTATHMQKPQFVCVVGTDTGVGKTLVTAGLARVFVNRAVKVLAIKPVESGCPREVSDIEDGAILARATGQSYPTAALMRLREPLAPPLAAELEHVTLDINQWYEQIQALASDHELVLVEGAGGLLSPLTWEETALDLAVALNASALVVASDKLGSLNHTLLTLHALQSANIPVLGVIFSAPEHSDQSSGGNAASLAKFSNVSRVCEIPRVHQPEQIVEYLDVVSRWIVNE